MLNMVIKNILSILLILSLCLNVYPVSRQKSFTITTGDGDLSKTVSGFSAWPTAHAATSGTADDSGTQMKAYASFALGFPSSRATIERAFIPVDISGEPQGVRIDSGGAKMRIYVFRKTNGDNDGDDWINIVGLTTQASTSSLTANDFDNCGAVTNPTEYATRIDLGSITTGAYNEWTINATGITEIESQIGSGVVKWGVREGHDCINSTLMSASTNEVTMITADGTGSYPKLQIENYSYPQVM